MGTLKLSLRDNGVWYAVGTINKKKINHSSGFHKPDKKAAREWLLKHELQLLSAGSRNMDSQKFKNLIDLYVLDQPNMSDKEFRQINIVIKHLGSIPIKKVRTNLDEYIRVRHASNQPNTIERDVNSRIGTIINYGRDRNLCGEFLANVKHVDDTRSVFLSKELRDRYLEKWTGEAKDFTTVLLFQGLRFGQAARLRCCDVMGLVLKTFTQKGPKKTYRDVNLYTHPKVLVILNKRATQIGLNDLVFPNIDYDRYRYQHSAICKELGVPEYRIHDNRTTFATHYSHDALASDREVASALSQKTSRNVPRYAQNREMKNLINKLT